MNYEKNTFDMIPEWLDIGWHFCWTIDSSFLFHLESGTVNLLNINELTINKTKMKVNESLIKQNHYSIIITPSGDYLIITIGYLEVYIWKINDESLVFHRIFPESYESIAVEFIEGFDEIIFFHGEGEFDIFDLESLDFIKRFRYNFHGKINMNEEICIIPAEKDLPSCTPIYDNKILFFERIKESHDFFNQNYCTIITLQEVNSGEIISKWKINRDFPYLEYCNIFWIDNQALIHFHQNRIIKLELGEEIKVHEKEGAINRSSIMYANSYSIDDKLMPNSKQFLIYGRQELYILNPLTFKSEKLPNTQIQYTNSQYVTKICQYNIISVCPSGNLLATAIYLSKRSCLVRIYNISSRRWIFSKKINLNNINADEFDGEIFFRWSPNSEKLIISLENFIYLWKLDKLSDSIDEIDKLFKSWDNKSKKTPKSKLK